MPAPQRHCAHEIDDAEEQQSQERRHENRGEYLIDALLRAAAVRRPQADVRFGNELVRFTDNRDSVTALIGPADGQPYEVTADWLRLKAAAAWANPP